MERIAIVFPHQLFESSPLITTCNTFCLLEEILFFRQFNFHKQKIAYHRATMKWYASYLKKFNKKVIYVDAHDELQLRCLSRTTKRLNRHICSQVVGTC
jgi:deoxyribodipyrimidine photolyase-related protein